MSLWIILLSTIVGVGVGYYANFSPALGRRIDGMMLYCMFGLIALMGLKLGLDEMLFGYIAIVGLQALALAAAAIVGSVLTILLFERIALSFGKLNVFGDSEKVEVAAQSPLKMTLIVFACLVVGVASARLLPPVRVLLPYLDSLITIGLCLMVFVAGFGIGKSKDILGSIRRSGIGLLIVPAATMIGSIVACVCVSALLGIPLATGGVVGGSVGWYSLSGMVLSNVSIKLGALAFLANMFREVASFLVVPFLAKRFGPFVAIAPCGCTAMDSTLPIIVKSTSPANTIVAFSSGVILSLCVPIVIDLFMPFLGAF